MFCQATTLVNREHQMGIERTDIWNAIIAGIAEGGGVLNQMSEVVTHLELAGFVIVPKDPTQDILDCRPPFMTVQDARAMWRTMMDAAVART